MVSFKFILCGFGNFQIAEHVNNGSDVYKHSVLNVKSTFRAISLRDGIPGGHFNGANIRKLGLIIVFAPKFSGKMIHNCLHLLAVRDVLKSLISIEFNVYGPRDGCPIDFTLHLRHGLW